MCTTYINRKKDKIILAQNYDFYYDHGLIVTNKRGIRKSNLELEPYLIEWISKYGSVTFNQFARELPTCGMNEKGLAIALMWHEGAVPEPKDNRPFLNELQWIQYQLDNFSSVPEVLAEIEKLRISMEIFPLHYTIADSNGNSAIIEFVNQELKIYENPNIHILTNSNYESSLKYSKEKPHSSSSDSSLDRFCRIYNSFDKEQLENEFERLDLVKIRPKISSVFNWVLKGIPPTFTYWSIIYDCTNMAIHYSTKESSEIKSIKCSNFDYSNETDVLVLDINENLKGNVNSSFIKYTKEHNERIVRKSFKPIKDKVSVKEQEELINIPEQFIGVE